MKFMSSKLKMPVTLAAIERGLRIDLRYEIWKGGLIVVQEAKTLKELAFFWRNKYDSLDALWDAVDAFVSPYPKKGANAYGGLAESPCGVGIGIGTIDVGLMKVLISRRIGTSPHIVVKGTVPIHLHGYTNLPLVFGLSGNEIAPVFFVLSV